MSAGRNASSLLIALIGTVILFVAFAATINLPFLSKYSYTLDYGWKKETPSVLANERTRECPNPNETAGFPITTSRPTNSGLSCTETNVLAKELNLALCFAAATITAVGATGVMRNRP